MNAGASIGFCCGSISKPTTAGSGHFGHLHHSKYVCTFFHLIYSHLASYYFVNQSRPLQQLTVHFPLRSHKQHHCTFNMCTCTSLLGNNGAQPGTSPLLSPYHPTTSANKMAVERVVWYLWGNSLDLAIPYNSDQSDCRVVMCYVLCPRCKYLYCSTVAALSEGAQRQFTCTTMYTQAETQVANVGTCTYIRRSMWKSS